MDKDEDMFLLLQLKNGNIKVYEQLFKKYYRSLSIEAFYLLKDEMEAEDLVQTLFIEIWDRQLYRNINSSVRSYLHMAIRNKCLSAIEKNKNKQKRFDEYASTLEDRTDGNVIEMKETNGRINAIINELPIQRSTAFSLVYLENKKYKEAAEEMGISINSVKTHLKLAVKALQQKFIDLK